MLAALLLCLLPVSAPAQLDERQYDAVLDAVKDVYEPVFAARGETLIVERRWKDSKVDAKPYRGNALASVAIYGGMARAAGMTQDGLALAACHELGHLLGGFPRGNPGLANEGQSDYFATSKCLPRVFAHPGAAAFTRLDESNAHADKECARAFKDADRRAVCARSALAALSAIKMTSGWGEKDEPALDTPDPFRTTVTDDRHMPRQCRLDTQFQGALCAKPVSEDFSESSPEPGACTRSQGFALGLRPRCWYFPPDSEPDL